jgi:hypothetical protein
VSYVSALENLSLMREQISSEITNSKGIECWEQRFLCLKFNRYLSCVFVLVSSEILDLLFCCLQFFSVVASRNLWLRNRKWESVYQQIRTQFSCVNLLEYRQSKKTGSKQTILGKNRSKYYEAPHYEVFSSPPATLSLLYPIILLSTLFSKTQNVCKFFL